MDERVRFVARLPEGKKMAALCREFAISPKTGYKIFDRCKQSGLEAPRDRSRRPWRYRNRARKTRIRCRGCERGEGRRVAISRELHWVSWTGGQPARRVSSPAKPLLVVAFGTGSAV
jgi:hypothetical protein